MRDDPLDDFLNDFQGIFAKYYGKIFFHTSFDVGNEFIEITNKYIEDIHKLNELTKLNKS